MQRKQKSRIFGNSIINIGKKINRLPGTAGLVNRVLHGNRTQHQVIDVTEKTKHLFKI